MNELRYVSQDTEKRQAYMDYIKGKNDRRSLNNALAQKYILDGNIDKNEYLQAFYKYIRECRLFPIL